MKSKQEAQAGRKHRDGSIQRTVPMLLNKKHLYFNTDAFLETKLSDKL